MNDQEQALLDQLRDVVTPQAPGWWPLAVGWWVTIALLVSLLLGVLFFMQTLRKKRQREQWRKSALNTHQIIRAQLIAGANQHSKLAELSVLMRRVALVLLPRQQIAAATDDNWLATLDSISGTSEYSRGVGQLLGRAPYQTARRLEQHDLVQLLDLTETTIKAATPQAGYQEGSTVAAI